MPNIMLGLIWVQTVCKGYQQTTLGDKELKKFLQTYHLLSCQPRVTVTSCFVYRVIRDLDSIDHLCMDRIN